jgi:hypothetical protein
MASIGDINTEAFLAGYARAFNDRLGPKATQGMRDLIAAINADKEVTDPRWIAYMLATIKLECGNTWLPIEEWGKGKGRPYGAAVEVKDPKTGETFRNAYYGRGFVQLTWLANYQRLDRALGLGDSLWLHPERALEPDIAWRICSLGMRKGLFTGKGLPDYIQGATCDYVNARRIINGTDKAALIAGYAMTFEDLLEVTLA